MWATTAIALLGLVGLGYAQDAPVASLEEAFPGYTEERTALEAGKDHVPVVAPITDDGRKGDEWMQTTQLMIALQGITPRTLQVEVLDERGRHMRDLVFADVDPRVAIPVSVGDLPQGRYALRISGEARTRVVRFRR